MPKNGQSTPFAKLKVILQNWTISTSHFATIKVVGFGCP